MSRRSIRVLTVALVLASLPSTRGLSAAECPVAGRENRAYELLVAVEHASSCAEAAAIFASCARGTAGEVASGQTVVKRCEGGFLSKLDAADRDAYQRKQKQCTAQAVTASIGQDVSPMSGITVCRAELARDYWQRHGAETGE